MGKRQSGQIIVPMEVAGIELVDADALMDMDDKIRKTICKVIKANRTLDVLTTSLESLQNEVNAYKMKKAHIEEQISDLMDSE